jgi:hypothetical protein
MVPPQEREGTQSTPKGALIRWYIPWNWFGGFYEAIYFIKSGVPYKSGDFLWSAGFYEVNHFIKSAGPIS